VRAAIRAILISDIGDEDGIVSGYGENLEYFAAKFCVWVISNSTTVII
jgi:hypothetical protein